MTKYVAALCLAASWLVPVHFPPWVSWQNELPSFFAVILLAWYGVIHLARRKDFSTLPAPVATLPFLALMAIAAIQAATGRLTFAGDALVVSFYLALSVVCLSLGFATASKSVAMPMEQAGIHRSPGYPALKLLAMTCLAGAFLSAIAAFAQVFELWESSNWISRMPWLRRPGGNLGQSNQLATLLLMGLASLMFLYESRRLGALAATLLALTLLTGVAVTESRTSVLSVGLLLVWCLSKRGPLGFRLSPWVAAGGGATFLCLFWYWPSLIGIVQQTLGAGGASAQVDVTVGDRWLVWPQLAAAVLLRPWWGWGLGQVSAAHNAVAHAYTVSEPFTYAHNIVLDLALGLGLPLTVMIVLVTAVWLWLRVRSVSNLTSWYCVALVLPVAVHSMLEFPFAYAYFLAPVMFALGALEGTAGTKPAFSLGVKPAAALLLSTTVLMAWSVPEYVAIEEDFRVLRFEALRIGTTPADYGRPHVVLLTQLDALLHGGRIVPRPGMSAEEVELSRKVALRFPWPATQHRYALSLALNSKPDEAIRQLLVMRAQHGEEAYAQIKAGWMRQAKEKYPQLLTLKLP